MTQRAARPRLVAGLLGGLAALVIFIVVVLVTAGPVTSGSELPLSSLQALATAGHVQTAVLYEADHRVAGTYLPSTKGPAVQFWAEYPSSEAETPVLIDRLAAGGATVSVDRQSGKAALLFAATYLAPALLVAGLVLLFALTRGGSGSLRMRLPRSSGLSRAGRRTFAEVAGADAAVEQLSEVVAHLRAPGRLAAGIQPPRAVLLHGPPGCGKRLLAEAAAGEGGAWFFAHSGADIAESLLDGRAAAGRDAFAWARAAAPAVVYVADLEAAGAASGPDGSRALHHLLVEIDGITPADRVVIIAGARSLEALDPSLLRPGRFDRQIAIELPDISARNAILHLHARGIEIDETADLAGLAQRTSGLAGADLAALLHDAAAIAQRDGRRAVLGIDLDAALQQLTASTRARGRVMSPDERRRAAVHEAGHASVAAALGRGRYVQRLSIQAHGRGLGRILSAPEQREVLSRSDLLAELTVLCAGMSAEELYFDEPSTGSADDLRRATELARAIAADYGMSTKVGRVHIEVNAGGAATGEAVDELNREVRRLLDDATSAATDRLQRCHDPLVDLVLQLERDEVVEGVQLGDILIRALEVEIAGIASTPPPASSGARDTAPVQSTRARRR